MTVTDFRPASARLSGALLCGGQSRRMGVDKARLQWCGEPLLLRGLKRLATVCEELLLASGRPGRYGDLFGTPGGAPLPAQFAGRPLREVPDRELPAPRGAAATPTGSLSAGSLSTGAAMGFNRSAPSSAPGTPGPLAGLEAALFASQGEWVWITSCDLPLLEPELGLELFDLARGRQVDALLCLGPGIAGKRLPEPLCAVYRRELWRSARAALEAGQRRVLSLVDYAWDGPTGAGAGRHFPRLGSLELSGAKARQLFNLNTPEDWQSLTGPTGAIGGPASGEQRA